MNVTARFLVIEVDSMTSTFTLLTHVCNPRTLFLFLIISELKKEIYTFHILFVYTTAIVFM